MRYNIDLFRNNTFFLIVVAMMISTPAQAQDATFTLPPLPAELPQLIDSSAPPPNTDNLNPTAQSAPVITLNAATSPSDAGASKAGARVSEDALDDLIPAAVTTSAVADPVTTPAIAPSEDKLISVNADTPSIDASNSTLAKLPTLPEPLPNIPKKPMTLEEEAAAAGFLKPKSDADLPETSAQALLSGQSLGIDDENQAQQIPEIKVERKQTYRDMPKLRPVIVPRRYSFNYKRTTLPPSIYRKQYNGENQHLPVATYRDDYDRALFGAVAANDINGVRAFLNRGAAVNMLNATGDTLLITAVRYGAIDTARLLLARGANPLLIGANGATAMQYALASRQNELALILKARGA